MTQTQKKNLTEILEKEFPKTKINFGTQTSETTMSIGLLTISQEQIVDLIGKINDKSIHFYFSRSGNKIRIAFS